MSVTAEKSLDTLLASLSPELIEGEYVFCVFPHAKYGDYLDLEPVASISEKEGLTLVLPKSKADDEHLSYESVFRRLTLTVHSSLEAVGLTAAFSAKLTEHGISANVIAGYYHDHVFVQTAYAERAMKALDELSA